MSNATAKSIFLAAIEEYSSDQWPAYLEEACGCDSALRFAVEKLLAGHQRLGAFHELTAEQVTTPFQLSPPGNTEIGTGVGHYFLREKIAEGGMGVVYVAEQTEPVRRKVAFKVIKPGLASREIIARFETERQALALMDHPHIARVIDAGATESGLPYFVMELVQGLPIHEYCDQHQLNTDERLKLFARVCRAVQHAHQKGIIHRDLKPSNVLVAEIDDEAVPKVIDFGIAKAVHQKLTDKTVYTQFSQMVGTPMYMSPEQVAMGVIDVDTRSDIYSLGVLLYELLTGAKPFDVESMAISNLDELRRIIREQDPPRPSRQVSTLRAELISTVAERRRSDPRKLSALLRGDLDWIVMKALAKDRRERYDTVGDFANDIDHFLNSEPVDAGPPTVTYRVRKFLRRHRLGVAVSGIITAACLTATVSISWVALNQRAQKRLVEREVVLLLRQIESLLEEDRPFAALAASDQVNGLIEGWEVEGAIAKSARQTQANVRLIQRLEEIQLQVTDQLSGFSFDYASIIPEYKITFGEYGCHLSEESSNDFATKYVAQPEVVRNAILAGLYDWAFRLHLQESQSASDPQVEGIQRDPELTPGGDLSQVSALLDKIDDNPWRRKFWQAVQQNDVGELSELATADDCLQQPSVILNIVASKVDVVSAVSLLEQAILMSPQDLWLNIALGSRLSETQPPRKDEALRYLQAALALRPQSPGIHVNLALSLELLGDQEGAIEHFRRVCDLQPNYWRARLDLGNLLEKQGDLTGALEQFRIVVSEHPTEADGYFQLAYALEQAGDLRTAAELLRTGLEIRPHEADAENALGYIVERWGRIDQALTHYRIAAKIDPSYALFHGNVGRMLIKQGSPFEAIHALQRATELDPELEWVQSLLGKLLAETRQWDRVRHVVFDDSPQRFVDYLLRVKQSQTEPGPWMLVGHDAQFFNEVARLLPDDWRPWATRARVRMLEEKWQQAAADFERALGTLKQAENWQWWNTNAMLALEAVRSPRVAELLLEARPEDGCLKPALVREYIATGKTAEAVKLFQTADDSQRDHWTWFVLAPLQLHEADRNGYEESCEHLLKRYSSGGYATLAMTALACSIEKDFVIQHRRALDDLQQKIEAQAENPGWSDISRLAMALKAYHLGQYDEARRLLETPSKALGNQAMEQFIAVLVEWSSGDVERANQMYQAAVQFLEEQKHELNEIEYRKSIHYWLIAELLHREATKKIKHETARSDVAKRVH